MDPSFTGNTEQSASIENTFQSKEQQQDQQMSIVPTDGGTQERKNGLANDAMEGHEAFVYQMAIDATASIEA